MTPIRPTVLALFVGDTTDAIIECDKILSTEARPNPEVFLIRGWAHAQRGEYETAVHDCSRFIHAVEISEGLEAPALGFGYRLRATCYEEQGEWNLSLSDLQRALEFYDEDDTDVDDLAELRAQQRRVEQEKTDAFSSEDDVSLESEASVRMAQRREVLDALVDGQLERALELCTARLDDKDKSILFLRGLAKDFRGRRCWTDSKLEAVSDFGDAISDYSDVIADATSHFLARAYVRRSQLLIALGCPKEAIAGLDELDARQLLEAHEPLNIYALLDRGVAAIRVYDYDMAGDAFERVLDLDPENIRALDGNGLVDLYTEERQAALERFKKGLETSRKKQEKPNIAHFMSMISLTYYLEADYEAAMEVLKAIEPILRELEDSERRELQQRVDSLRQFLPAIPDSEAAFEEQRQLFKVSEVEEVKCKAYLLCVVYQALHRTRLYQSVAEELSPEV